MTEDPVRQGIGKALAQIPSGLYILTSRFEDRRVGMLASWVQQTCFEPPMVMVAVGKGRSIIPLLAESRHFGLCQLAKDDKVLLRKFASRTAPEEDPFLGFDLVPEIKGNVPILASAMAYMVCEVAGHMDAGGDHDIFVGQVLSGNCFAGEPHIHLRSDGFKY